MSDDDDGAGRVLDGGDTGDLTSDRLRRGQDGGGHGGLRSDFGRLRRGVTGGLSFPFIETGPKKYHREALFSKVIKFIRSKFIFMCGLSFI